MPKRLEIYRVHDKAKEISGSKAWAIYLRTMRDRTRFEDGYLKGWMDSKKHYAKMRRVQQTTNHRRKR